MRITFIRDSKTGAMQVGGIKRPTPEPSQPEPNRTERRATSTGESEDTLSAYQAFFRSNFEACKADEVRRGQKLDVNSIVALIGRRWRELDAAGRAAWEGSTVVKKKKAPRKGPKSLTAYQLFFRENTAQLSGKAPGYTRAEGITQNEIVSAVGARWRAIAPDELADYTARAAAITAQLKVEAEAQELEAGADWPAAGGVAVSPGKRAKVVDAASNGPDMLYGPFSGPSADATSLSPSDVLSGPFPPEALAGAQDSPVHFQVKAI